MKALFPFWYPDLGFLGSAYVVGCEPQKLIFLFQNSCARPGLKLPGFSEVRRTQWVLAVTRLSHASLELSFLLSFLNILSFLLYKIAIITKVWYNRLPKHLVAKRSHHLLSVPCTWVDGLPPSCRQGAFINL